MTIPIDVLIPSFNCVDWIERCLYSVAIQTVPPRRVLLIDDASTDPAYSTLAKKLCEKHGFTYQWNPVNLRCPRNLYEGIKALNGPPDGVVFLLDGDDFLPHDRVFARFTEIYADDGVWLTYGQYAPWPRNTGQILAAPYSEDVIYNHKFRKDPGGFNHPLTFRKWLWDQLDPSDMQKPDGTWFTAGYDMIIMIPLLEMSSPWHFLFLNEVLYTYNAINPLSDVTVGHVLEVEESREIMNRPPFARICKNEQHTHQFRRRPRPPR